jgi:hypothetical protein
MTAPLLLNALQLAWTRLLRSEAITEENIHTAPLKVVAAGLEAASHGETDAATLADAAITEWQGEPAQITLN